MPLWVRRFIVVVGCAGLAACAKDKKSVLGLDCEDPGDCKSGFCVSDVCCENACNGPCEACDLPESRGRCVTVSAGEDPKGQCGSGTDCGGACDGSGNCAYPGADTACGSCRQCDGAGGCVDVADGEDPFGDCGTGVCGGVCDGQGGCGLPGVEQRCDSCRACDGAGGCADVVAGDDPFDDCTGGPPCGSVCDGSGGCVYPDTSVQCGLACQHCDGSGTCLADCSDTECQQNVWECQCHPVATTLTCGSTEAGSLVDAGSTTDLFDTYGGFCNWLGSDLDGREMVYRFSYSSGPNSRTVTVTISSQTCLSEIEAMALDGSFTPCDPTACISGQTRTGPV